MLKYLTKVIAISLFPPNSWYFLKRTRFVKTAAGRKSDGNVVFLPPDETTTGNSKNSKIRKLENSKSQKHKNRRCPNGVLLDTNSKIGVV
jgi:hypothetical protein